MPISFPSGRLNKANNLSTVFGNIPLNYGQQFNNCSNTFCYTYSKNYIYKPHSAYGMVATTAASYLGRRRRL